MRRRRKRSNARRRRLLRVAALGTLALIVSGCSAPSLRIALDAQRRADEVQQFIFEQQQEAARVMAYRALVQRLEDEQETALTDAQLAALSDAWNQCDLLAFWSVQNERARALRLVGVDAKLWADQSPVDLLIKSIEQRGDRVKDALAAAAGAQLEASDE